MTISCKLYKTNVVLSTISIIEEEKKLYAEIHHFDQDIVNTN